MDLNYIEHVLILASAVTGYVSVSACASLVGICIGITSSAIGLNICAIIAKIKKYKSMIKHGKMVLLAKTKVSTIEVLISRVLIDSYISHD